MPLRSVLLPIGFVVPLSMWEQLKAQTVDPGPGSVPLFNGVRIVVDESMDDGSCDVCHSEEAWQKRLAEIKPGKI